MYQQILEDLQVFLKNFKDACSTHAATNTHGHRHTFGAATLAFDQRVARQALSTHAVWVAHSNSATVHIQTVSRNA